MNKSSSKLKDYLRTYSASKKMHVATLAFMFAIMLVFNMLTKIVADDYTYAFSFATGERIDSIASVIDSVIAHGEQLNGRYFAHFFAQVFLMLPGIIFDVVNSLVFVSTIYMVYLVCNKEKKTNNLLLLSIFAADWLFQHDFGQVNLWLDGACNYLFGVFFGLLFILPYVNSLLYQKHLHPLLIIPHMAVSVILGGYLEPLSVGFVCMAGLFLLAELFWFKNFRALVFVPSLLCSVFGLAIMVFAPAERVNKLSEFSLSNILTVFGMVMLMIASVIPLIIIFAVLYRRQKRSGGAERLLFTAAIIAIGALASNFIMLIAKYYAARCSISFIFLSIFATALLYARVDDNSLGKHEQVFVRIFVICTAVCLVLGFADNLATFIQLENNEARIEEALERGDATVELKIPVVFTKYNCLMGIRYLDDENPRAWPNCSVAEYYGFDTVVGKRQIKGIFGGW